MENQPNIWPLVTLASELDEETKKKKKKKNPKNSFCQMGVCGRSRYAIDQGMRLTIDIARIGEDLLGDRTEVG